MVFFELIIIQPHKILVPLYEIYNPPFIHEHKYKQNIYLNDNKTFIEKPQGKNIYLATLIYENNFFSLREFTNNGFLYCGQDIDPNCQKKIALTTQDHDINYILIKNNAPLFVYMKTIFEKGAFRFQNLTCKQCILKCLQFIYAI